MPDRHWDLQHLELDLTIDVPAGTVAGTATHTVAPIGAPHRWLRLHQVALDISKVTVNGRTVEGWRTGEQTLDIPMPSSGDAHEVSITYTAAPESGIHFRDPKGSADPVVEVWSQGENTNNRFWYPGWDHPSDRFTVTGRYTVPEGLSAYANGVLKAEPTTAEGWTTFEYEMKHQVVNYLVTLTVGDYELYTDKTRIPFEYVVPKGTGEQAAKRGLDGVKDQLAFFDELLGAPYPYPVYRQVVVSRFLYSGMENTTQTTLGDHLLLREPDWRGWRTEAVVSHELAHQWFGDWMTCYGWRELWLNEGFAKYYEIRWLEQHHGEEAVATLWRGNRRSAMGSPKRPMATRSWSKDGKHDHVRVYSRGASVLRLLEHHLGREVFDAGIRRYVAENQDRMVESEDLRRALEDESGKQLGWLFDQFVTGVGFPSAETSWTHDEGELVLNIEQTTKDTTPYSLPIDVEIGLAKGTPMRRTIWLGEGATKLVLDLDEPPLWVAFDPYGAALVHLDETQESGAWTDQLEHSPSAYAQLVAMAQLGKAKATPESVTALTAALQDTDRHVRLRMLAADPLGELSSPESIDALLACTSKGPSQVRERCIDALEQVPAEDAVVDKLAQLMGDDDLWVSASAMLILAEHDDERALSTARKQLKKRPEAGQNDLGITAPLKVIQKRGSDKDLKTLYQYAAVTESRDIRISAARAMTVRIEDMDEEQAAKHRADATDALMPIIHDPDLKLRLRVIGYIGRIGDDRAEAALRALSKTTTIDELAERAAKAAAKIRNRGTDDAKEKPKDEDDISLGDRVDDMEERLKRLEDRY